PPLPHLPGGQQGPATGQRPMGTGRMAHGQSQNGNAQQPPFPQLRPLWAVSVDDVSQHLLPSIPGGPGIPPTAPWNEAEGGFIPAFEKVPMYPSSGLLTTPESSRGGTASDLPGCRSR